VKGGAYVAPVKIKHGETYYLMINYGEGYFKMYPNKTPKGFKVYFYNYWPKKKPIILKNVFFDNNSSTLLSNSNTELEKLAVMLNLNKQLNIEIRGHTDNVGKEKDNIILSEKRAKSVVDYLISKGISPKRLFYKGFGSSMPIATNDDEIGRQKNRRVEFVFVMK